AGFFFVQPEGRAMRWMQLSGALCLVISIRFISDIWIGVGGMSLFLLCSLYFFLALPVLLGGWIQSNCTAQQGEEKRVSSRFRSVGVWLLGTLGSSVGFFVITNFAVWFSGKMYPKTWAGLMLCYEMAIPFFRNTVQGDFLFSSIFFGAHVLGVRWLRREDDQSVRLSSLS
ncbi:MAG: DUF6580 family putative transport protein, partial [Myxococcota bacterium]